MMNCIVKDQTLSLKITLSSFIAVLFLFIRLLLHFYKSELLHKIQLIIYIDNSLTKNVCEGNVAKTSACIFKATFVKMTFKKNNGTQKNEVVKEGHFATLGIDFDLDYSED